MKYHSLGIEAALWYQSLGTCYEDSNLEATVTRECDGSWWGYCSVKGEPGWIYSVGPFMFRRSAVIWANSAAQRLARRILQKPLWSRMQAALAAKKEEGLP